MHRRETTALVVVSGAALLFVIGWFGAPRMLTEMAIRKVLRDPTASLTEEESLRIIRYIIGDSTPDCPGSRIGEARQRDLLQVAVRRASALDDPGILIAATQRWLGGDGFEMLPHAVAEAINAGAPGAQLILATVSDPTGRIDPYLDVTRILSSKNSGLVLAAVVVLRMKTLREHQGACMRMLERDDVAFFCKRALLARIATDARGREWFRGNPETLARLIDSEDAEIRAWASRIREQMRTSTGASSDR